MPLDQHRPPWIIRTYAGFGGAEETNKRFHNNLKSGQTGISVAFDLPTQNGFDPDAPIARGEIGGTGVSVAHSGDMEALFHGIDLGRVNTSMTINATAPFILALYLVHAERTGTPWEKLRGTVQNDLLKEFVARGTSIFTPQISLRLSTDIITFTADRVPQWNPVNVCGYHYVESGARPHEEVGYALANALLILDAVRPDLSPDHFEAVVRRVSFFINSGIELVPEICKMRAYSRLWTEICQREYQISDVPFRAGCQVRSVSLTAQQPENNIMRIALEALPAILSASARVNALQLPGFREALSLPDRMEQTLSIRTQQILMHETKIADYGDIFSGNQVIAGLTDEIAGKAEAIAFQLRSSGYEQAIMTIDRQLTEAIMERERRIDKKEDIIVGLNAFADPVGLSEQLTPADSPAQDASFEKERIQNLRQWKGSRHTDEFENAVRLVREAASGGKNIMPATIAFARAGGTVGEWTSLIEEETKGRYSSTVSLGQFLTGTSNNTAPSNTRPPRIVLAKSGLDGHTNGIKVLALALRNAGIEVIYAGTKMTPDALVRIAMDEDADALAISSLAGAHMHIADEILSARRRLGLSQLKFMIGGIIPEEDSRLLGAKGVDLVITNNSGSLSHAVTRVCSLLATP